MKSFENKLKDPGMAEGDTAVEGKELSPARKAVLKGMLVLGMAGFWGNGSKMEAQNTGPHPNIEQKESVRPDFFRADQLAKDYAEYRLNIIPDGYNGHIEKKKKLQATYGPDAFEFVTHRSWEKMMAEEGGITSGTDAQKGFEANFLDEQKLIDAVLFDESLSKEIAAHPDGGYLVKQVEMADGQKTDVLVEYASADQRDPDDPKDTWGQRAELAKWEEGLAKQAMEPQFDAAEAEVAKDPVMAKKFEWEKKLSFRFTIKGVGTQPKWYEVRARTEKETDPRAPTF